MTLNAENSETLFMSFSLETVNVQSMQLQTLSTPQTYVQTKRLQDLGS